MHRHRPFPWVFLPLLWLPTITDASVSQASSMVQALHYPYVEELAAADNRDAIAWVSNIDGVRNVWAARGPDFTPLKLTQYAEDDGQEITQLKFSADATRLIYVRGGDHDANWPAEGNLAPDPGASPERQSAAIWVVSFKGTDPEKLADGDAPAVSSKDQVAFINDDQVWSVSLDGGKPDKLFFDRGKDATLRWSPDGSRLAFVSGRGDHSFIGIFSSKTAPLLYLAPSTGTDASPTWSPDGMQVAFARTAGTGGAPEPALVQSPHPWSLWVASVSDGQGHAVWRSPNTLAGSYPQTEGETNLHWMGDRLVFTAYLDEWPHLYSLRVAGGAPTLLTPGTFMVEHVAESRDHRYIIYDANTGSTAGDDDRRHVFRVPIDRAKPEMITSGESLEWTPVSAGGDRVAFVAAGPRLPPEVNLVAADGTHRVALPSGGQGFSSAGFVVPKRVTFQAADGLLVHGQMFESADSTRADHKPGIIFVHGGPERQMLLGWHYMNYYSNAYAVNQYLAAHGYVVLSVNYRLGIGYGRAFNEPERAGYAGAAEYQDVVAGAHFLQALPGVDAKRIGIWGGSYGGYLTALALARDAGIFKAGVDLHGVHDWSLLLAAWVGKPEARYEKGDRDQAMQSAWNSSPDSSIDGWKAPVLLIQGDDDRNVPFQQTIDLAKRLEARGLPHEELVIPNEIHGFLRHASWLRVDEATVDFFNRHLSAPLTIAMEYLRDDYADPSSLPANDIAGFFMESSFDAMLLVDNERCIECANSAAIRLLGQPGAAMLGRPVDDVVSLRLYPVARDSTIKENFAEFSGALFTVRRSDLPPATVVLRKSNGPSGRQLWVLRDVTRQQPIAEALERKARLLVEAERVGKMGAWELDTGTGLLLFTEELQHMLGLVDSPVLPLEYCYSFYTDASRAIVREAFSATMIHGTPYDLELEMKTQRGDLIWVREVCRATYRDGRMVSLTGITQDITERRRMADLLARGADLERARIGADLHDGLGQELTGLSLYLQGAAQRAERDYPDMSNDLAELAKIASKSIETVRDMTHSMLPLELRQMGFERVCQQLAATTQKSSGVMVKFRYLGHPSRVPVGSSAEHMYRIVQEAMANAVKHAGASRISVTLKASDTKLVLTVSDNGAGIDPTRTTGGIGLQIMRYRARLLGGLLDVRRSSSGGTIVRSVLPRCGDSNK